jgi:hypothetical protein
MSNEPENLVFDPLVVQRLESPEQVKNYIEERITSRQRLMEMKPPPPTNILTSADYLKWERRYMMAHGRAVEAVCAAQAFGHITVEEFKAYKIRLIAATLQKMGNVQLGKERR